MSDKKISLKNTNTTTHNQPDLLVKDISALIDDARSHVAREYNSTQADLSGLNSPCCTSSVIKNG